MTQPATPTTEASSRARRFPWSLIVAILTLLAGVCALIVWNVCSTPSGLIAELPLADGRTFRIEAVTFGTNHVVGKETLLANIIKRCGSWLPKAVVNALSSKQTSSKQVRSEIDTSHPSLVVWVNAIDTATGTNVDCQGVRIDIGNEGREAEKFGVGDLHWFGGVRAGHVFSVYPRHLTNLTVQITPWRTNVPAETVIINPAPLKPQPWIGSPLPQEQSVGEFAVRLDQLTLRTNHLSPEYYQTSTPYWHPSWQILEDGIPTEGWQQPAWIAEDATGNRGWYLGTEQPVLRYSAICYPSSTNEQAAEWVASLSSFDLDALQSNQLQDSVHSSKIGEVRFIGVFPSGSYVFDGGELLTNPPVKMGAVGGGARSGWTQNRKYLNPVRKQVLDEHYTDVPVIYLHVDFPDSSTRVGLRLRTEDGQLIPVQMEPQGSREGVWPFLLTSLSNVTMVTPEIVILRPLEAKFDVDTTTLSREEASESAELPEDVEGETVVDVFW